MIILDDIADKRCTSASKRPIKLCHVQKQHTGVGLRGKEGYSSRLKNSEKGKRGKATVPPFPCDLRRCQTVEGIHDSGFIQFSNLPPTLLHTHHAHVKTARLKRKIFLQLTLWLMALCSCQCGKWSLPQGTHLYWEGNYSCPSVTEYKRYKNLFPWWKNQS